MHVSLKKKRNAGQINSASPQAERESTHIFCLHCCFSYKEIFLSIPATIKSRATVSGKMRVNTDPAHFTHLYFLAWPLQASEFETSAREMGVGLIPP